MYTDSDYSIVNEWQYGQRSNKYSMQRVNTHVDVNLNFSTIYNKLIDGYN